MKQKINDPKELELAVSEIVRMIPHGRITSYGAVARAVGYPDHSRLIGRIMSRGEWETGFPAHRVLGHGGKLSASAHFGGEDRLSGMLEGEGHSVLNGRVKNWKKVFWEPLDEL